MRRTGPLELLGVDHLLTEEERDIQTTVRGWVQQRVAEHRRLVRVAC